MTSKPIATFPAVSVVIPTHNRPELMKRAVESVFAQTYGGQLEVIVVFDACDPMLPVLTAAPNRSLRAMVNHRSRGLAGARNSGILASAHDFVAFLDDDDHWMPTKLAQQMERFEEQPASLLVGTAMVVDDGHRLHERLVPGDTVAYSDLLEDRLPGLHSSSFVLRRSALLGEVGLIDEELPRSYGEDYDLLLRTAKVGRISVVNRPLLTVTWQGQSYFFGRWALYAEALQYLLAKHPGFATSRTAIGRIESQVAFALAASDQGREARRWAQRALAHDPRAIKAMLAILISYRLTTADRVTKVAARFGRGI
jgi:glycosyltransferase involved in cell wall biosynthesis